MLVACIAEEVDVSAIGEGLDCAFGDGVAADPVDGSNGHGVGMEGVWNAAFKDAEGGCVVGAWFCGVRRCFEHARFQFFYVLFAEEHVNADGVVGPWNQHDAVVFCSYGASSAKAEKVGFELNVGDGPVVLGVVTLG